VEAGVARRVAASTLAQVLGRAVALGAGAVSVVLLTRYLGAAGYGRMGLAVSYVGVFGVLADLGIVTVLVRELARSPERREELVGTAMALRLALSGGMLALAALVSLVLPYDERVRVAILLLGVPLALTGLNSGLVALFQAELRLDWKVVGDVLGRIAAVAAIALVVGLDLGFYAAVLTSAVGAVAQLAASVVLARRVIRVRPRVDPPRWRALARAAIPVGASLAVAELLFRVDTVIVSLFRPYREVGLYTLAYRVLELTAALPAILLASAYPLLARWAGTEPERARRVLGLSTDAFVALGLPLAVGGALLAPGIVALTGGEDFGGATDPLRILLASVVLSSVNGLCGYALIAAGRQRDALRLGLGGLALNVVANLALVPSYGIDAAAAVTVLTEIGLLAGSLVLVARHLDWRPRATVLVRPGAACVVMAAVLVPLLDAPVLLAVAAGAVAYGLALLAVGGVDLQLLRSLRQV